jgi:hypothetical protein
VPTAPADSVAPPSKDALMSTYLRTLAFISRNTGGPTSFADLAAAKAWLATRASVR